MERVDAIALLRQHVTEESLLRHSLATGAIMKAVAVPCGGDPGVWETIGILHDIDFEMVGGDMQRHGREGARLLTATGMDADIIAIIEHHNHFLHVDPYELPVEIALQAADSASGLIMACARVKGGNLAGVSVTTILKKAKEKSFAAGCDRNRIALVSSLMDLPVFYDHALRGMMMIHPEIGL